jgi:hypothetical protein
LSITELVRRLDLFLVGWSHDFGTGSPRCAFRSLNTFVSLRMIPFLRRQSPRPFKPPHIIEILLNPLA